MEFQEVVGNLIDCSQDNATVLLPPKDLGKDNAKNHLPTIIGIIVPVQGGLCTRSASHSLVLSSASSMAGMWWTYQRPTNEAALTF